jgi:hypothetical protein
MAYDPQRRVVMMFGGSGSNGASLADTWVWDEAGGTWTQEPLGTPPTPRRGAALFYSPELGRMVLYGGQYQMQTLLDDLWSWNWDLRQWEVVAQPGIRVARALSPVVREPTRGVYLVFGGLAFVRDETFELSLPDGTWTQRLPAHHPPARYRHSMALDRQSGRIILFGGGTSDEPCQYDDTWAWNDAAGDWEQLAVGASPRARGGAAAATDPASGGVVLFGGAVGFCPFPGLQSVLDDTWVWDGGSWMLPPRAPAPGTRPSPTLAYDALRQRLVLYGGASPTTGDASTWEWDGQRWIEATGPSPRREGWGAMAFDGRRVIMIGTDSAGNRLGTWAWNGQAWSLLTTIGPTAIRYEAMAYDRARDRVVLYGGEGTAQQTWEWNGTLWERRMASPPTAAQQAVMTYDDSQQKVVLYGGFCGTNCFQTETWVWDGVIWWRLDPGGPVSPVAASLVFDYTRRRLLLGGNGTPYQTALWEWTGLRWTPLETPGLVRSSKPGLAYDEAHHRLAFYDVQLHTNGCSCYADCDYSGAVSVNDLACFLQRFVLKDLYANCDGSTTQPVLNVEDFVCFQQRFAAGCR